MILLLEGADCSGKTTLAETLREALSDRATYVHHTQETNSVGEFSRTLNEAAERQTKDPGSWTIIDRLWISEMIYGPIMRNGNRDSEGIIARLCHMHGVVTVMCVRDDLHKHLQHFVDGLKDRTEYPDKQRIKDIIYAYFELWHGSSAKNMRYSMREVYEFFARFAPLKMLRGYYQYDMDKFTAEQFVNWLLRLES